MLATHSECVTCRCTQPTKTSHKFSGRMKQEPFANKSGTLKTPDTHKCCNHTRLMWHKMFIQLVYYWFFLLWRVEFDCKIDAQLIAQVNCRTLPRKKHFEACDAPLLWLGPDPKWAFLARCSNHIIK